MQYLRLENVSKSYGEKVLFNDINLSISQGDKIALVAKNGSGKTTLLKVIAGEEGIEGETARIHLTKGVRVAFLKQDPDLPEDATALEAVFESDSKAVQAIKHYERALLEGDNETVQKYLTIIEDLKAWDIETRIKEILFRLNLEDLRMKISTMSGGQKKRVALAKLLIAEPDFLILDEPTNHLDLDMIEWLEDFLSQSSLTLFMVTHDRYFLENVCNQIIELDRGVLYTYSGSYSDYLEKKATREYTEAVNLDKTKRLFQKELAWVRRQPKARGTKAKSRVDKFYDIKEEAGKRLDDDELNLNIKSARLGSKILEAHALQKSYDDKIIVDGFDYKFKKGEKVGIVGKNGVGKTTFLKLLTKDIRPDGGKVVVGDTIVFGYYTQSGMHLKEDKRVIEVVRDIAEYIPLEKGKKLTAESLLERFLFPRSQQQVYVSQLSGGEKRRLYLLTVLMANPNFLILDEPTNDLDILTLNILEEYLMDFPGCVIVVSHDRYFMDKIVDHLFIMEGNGIIKDYNGTYSAYRQSMQEIEKQSKNVPSGKENIATVQETSTVTYEERKQYNRLLKEIEKLEKKKEEVTALFDDMNLSPDRIKELSIELSAVKDKIESKELEWMELAERLGI